MGPLNQHRSGKEQADPARRDLVRTPADHKYQEQVRPKDPKSLKLAEESSSAEPVPPPPSTSSSNQPPLVAMAHLAFTRASRDSAMAAGIAPDPSDRKSEEADTEARPGMTALTLRDPSDDPSD